MLPSCPFVGAEGDGDPAKGRNGPGGGSIELFVGFGGERGANVVEKWRGVG